MSRERLDFEVEDKKYYVSQPTQEQIVDADLIYKSKYSDAIRMGALTHQEAARIIEQRNIWSKDDSKKATKLLTDIAKLGHNLGKLPKSEFQQGLDMVTEIEAYRTELILLNQRRNSILDNTAESYADEKRLQFYVTQCIYTDAHELVFGNVTKLIEANDSILAAESVKYMIYLLANQGEDFRAAWPDYQWRKEQGLVDDDLNPVEGALDKLVADAMEKDVTVKKTKKAPRKRKKKTTAVKK